MTLRRGPHVTRPFRPRVAVVRAHRDQRGVALIESLVASMLLGVALVGLVGSYSTLAIASRKAEQQAVAEAAVRAEAARVKAAAYSAAGTYTLDTAPTGMGLVAAVEWWDGTSTWVSTTNANGLERVTITASTAAPIATLATVQIVKANR
jgi:Tfp pilus assembly protein PilV